MNLQTKRNWVGLTFRNRFSWVGKIEVLVTGNGSGSSRKAARQNLAAKPKMRRRFEIKGRQESGLFCIVKTRKK